MKIAFFFEMRHRTVWQVYIDISEECTTHTVILRSCKNYWVIVRYSSIRLRNVSETRWFRPQVKEETPTQLGPLQQTVDCKVLQAFQFYFL
jgi:hypothetical protein